MWDEPPRLWGDSVCIVGLTSLARDPNQKLTWSPMSRMGLGSDQEVRLTLSRPSHSAASYPSKPKRHGTSLHHFNGGNE